MREKNIEEYLAKRVREIGGAIRKVKWIGVKGCPDRYIIYRGGHWVELKKPGGKLSKQQIFNKKLMQDNGININVLDSKEGVDLFIKILKGISDNRKEYN